MRHSAGSVVREPRAFQLSKHLQSNLNIGNHKSEFNSFKRKKNPRAKLDLVFEYRKLYQDYGNRKEFEINM